jgi:poly(A) polymerase
MNALYYDPINEQIVDYVGGVNDIANHRINPVIPLRSIFSDDPVRMVRAIKYAATTGFVLPFLLRQQIKKTAARLAAISPSRITEELVKIINSGHTAEIVSMALELNLYVHLQPAATACITENPNFKKNYIKRLQALDSLQPIRFGEKLSFLLYDYILSLKDWKTEIANGITSYSELYEGTWKQCRSFILPMNPQRIELEFAIHHVLKQIGVPVKTKRPPRFRRRPKNRT